MKVCMHEGRDWFINVKGPVQMLMELYLIATGSNSVTCHLPQVNTPALTPARYAGTQFTYSGGMARLS